MKRFPLYTSLSAALLFALGSLTVLAPLAHAQQPSPLAGQWRTVDESTGEARSIVEIYQEEGGALSGQVVQMIGAAGDAERNDAGQVVCAACEGEREGQPVEGMVVLWGLEEGEGQWSGGHFVDTSDGQSYEAAATLLGEDRLEVHTYTGTPLFGRTQTWQRVSE